MKVFRHSQIVRPSFRIEQVLELPAPELNMQRPTLRVRHYMRKLSMYLMVPLEKRKKYDKAATCIQRAWTACLDRRRMRDMAGMVCFGRSELLSL